MISMYGRPHLPYLTPSRAPNPNILLWPSISTVSWFSHLRQLGPSHPTQSILRLRVHGLLLLSRNFLALHWLHQYPARPDRAESSFAGTSISHHQIFQSHISILLLQWSSPSEGRNKFDHWRFNIEVASIANKGRERDLRECTVVGHL